MGTLAEIMMVAVIDTLIAIGLANGTLSNTETWVVGTATAVISFGIIIDAAANAWRKLRQPPTADAP